MTSQYRITKITTAIFLIFFISIDSLYAQREIKGKIISSKDGKPAAFASIKLINRNHGTVSDTAGNFRFSAQAIKSTDTLLISSVGYEDLKIPAQKALQLFEFKLLEKQKMLASVIIRSFNQEDVAGANSEIVGYFRSWNTDNTKGEIGRTFLPAHKEYKISKVRFKVYSTYDTCTIRLHIREVANGQPGREILRDSIAQKINKSLVADTPYEFDLNKYNVVLSQQNIFVSFQVLDGIKSDKTERSLSFIGSEEGSYFYKSGDTDSWHSSDEYTIYMKLFLKYDD